MDQYDNVLFFNENKMIDDPSFELMQSGSTWNLRINNIKARHAGRYRCVVNTVPIKMKYYELTVLGKLISLHS